MSRLSRSALAAASLLLAFNVNAAGPLQAELLQVDLPLRAAAAKPAPATGATAPATSAALLASTPAPQRSRAEVIAELRAARAAGQLNHAEAEIGWPLTSRNAR